jgi:hypothetical protein
MLTIPVKSRSTECSAAAPRAYSLPARKKFCRFKGLAYLHLISESTRHSVRFYRLETNSFSRNVRRTNLFPQGIFISDTSGVAW